MLKMKRRVGTKKTTTKEKDHQVVSTNFGYIKVFKDINASAPQDNDDDLYEAIEEEDVMVQRPVAMTEDDSKDEDFFGLKLFEAKKESDTDASSSSGASSLNYIDQQMFGQLERMGSELQAPRNEKQKVDVSRETKADIPVNLNYIDKEYFGNFFESKPSFVGPKSVDNGKHSIGASMTSISDLSDLNEIDKDYFGALPSAAPSSPSSKQSDSKPQKRSNMHKHIQFDEDKLIGNIKNYKEPPTEKSFFPPDNIPIITARNMHDDENDNVPHSQHIKKAQTTTDNRLPPSEHKFYQSELPTWYNIPKDDAVNILKSHIIYFNEETGLLALDKPYGLPSMNGPGVHLSVANLLPLLERKLNINYRLHMIHRLDCRTTGVLLLATNITTVKKLRKLFEEHTIIKQYVAITKGIPKPSEGEINIPLIRREINGIVKTHLSPNYGEHTAHLLNKPKKDCSERKNAISLYRVHDSNNEAALVEIQPKTGFQHQIRAHLAFGINCPILGDHKYSHYVDNLPQKLPHEILERLKIRQSKVRDLPMYLHAHSVILPEFHNNTNVFIKAKLPTHFLTALKKLKLKF